MSDSNRRISRVYMLPASTGRTHCVNPDIFISDFDVNILSFRQNSYRCSGSMDTPARLGLRDPLNPVNTRLEF